MRLNGEDMSDTKIVEKILRMVFPQFIGSFEQTQDIESLTVKKLIGSFEPFEHRLNQRSSTL